MTTELNPIATTTTTNLPTSLSLFISSLSLSLYSSPLQALLQALHPFQDLQLPSPFALPVHPPLLHRLVPRRPPPPYHEALYAANADSLSLLPAFLIDSATSAGPAPDSTAPATAAPASLLTPSLTSAPGCAAADLTWWRAAGAEAVFAHWEVSQDEAPVAERVVKAMEAEGVEMNTLHHVDDLPFEQEHMPTNYGGFREKVKGVAVRETIETPEEVKGLPSTGDIDPGEIPSLQDLGLNPTPTILQDGKPEALERSKKFATECYAQPYKENTRDDIYGASFLSKISPWLAMGRAELKKTATSTVSAASPKKNTADSENSGMNWLTFELLWRDFFRFITKKCSSTKKNLQIVLATACSGALALLCFSQLNSAMAFEVCGILEEIISS
ncbi:hypothetical protein C4D60_Mb11t18160 [Musa balbisiana]|uniref:Photolyase/cryptochrome alpha/beta domain-containing protein n=1 Tax=Musa balbisiana TaxID=52838 RepID=A0A4S8J4Z0_MUSBA|nr:hypothetical protein C4D60_Mb11t18160 [Musa balbisiana]